MFPERNPTSTFGSFGCTTYFCCCAEPDFGGLCDYCLSLCGFHALKITSVRWKAIEWQKVGLMSKAKTRFVKSKLVLGWRFFLFMRKRDSLGLNRQQVFGSMDGLAEWSKALASGASP